MNTAEQEAHELLECYIEGDLADLLPALIKLLHARDDEWRRRRKVSYAKGIEDGINKSLKALSTLITK